LKTNILALIHSVTANCFSLHFCCFREYFHVYTYFT